MSGGSRYVPSTSDGLPARLSGEWAKEKLFYLAKYMGIFNTAMKNRWQRVYFDLLAGAGRNIDETTREEFEGSPLVSLSLKDPFSQVILVEQDPTLAAALRSRVGQRAEVIDADCNDDWTINQLRLKLGYGVLGLAFIDNLGLDVPLRTIKNLTEGRRVDLAITFQIGDLKRNLKNALAGADSDRWTSFFGSDGWKEIAQESQRRNWTASDTATELLDFYGRRLNDIGYTHIAHSHRIMKNSRNVSMYRLVLAGKHERAVEFFDEISKIQYSGQRQMF